MKKNNSSVNDDVLKSKNLYEKEILDIKIEKNIVIEKLNNLDKEYSKIKNENITIYREKCELELALSKKNDGNEMTILELRSKIEILNEKLQYLNNENANIKRDYKEALKRKKV